MKDELLKRRRRPVSRLVAICGRDFCIVSALCLHSSAPKLTAYEQGGSKQVDIGVARAAAIFQGPSK